jgi:hypothetical protein
METLFYRMQKHLPDGKKHHFCHAIFREMVKILITIMGCNFFRYNINGDESFRVTPLKIIVV